MSIRYYILAEQYDTGPVKGDVMVWEGDYWHLDRTNETLLVRFLWEPNGYFFPVPKEDLIEFVAAAELEDPSEITNREKRIWSSPLND